MASDDSWLDNLHEKLSATRVLVVGDIMLDRYWFGDVDRISPEAPVPVVLVNTVEERLGGAGNVALNLTALGAGCTLVGITGADSAGHSVASIAGKAGVAHSLVTDGTVPTCIKQRIISRNQQLMRADFESSPNLSARTQLIDKVKQLIDSHDVVVFSDYGKGTLHDIESMIEIALDSSKPVLVDPKGTDFSRYQNATMITPNLKEFESVVGTVVDDQDMQQKAERLIAEHQLGSLLVTLSERGMKLFEPGKEPIHRIAHSQEVYDVSGAGDTVIGAMAVSIAAGLDMNRSLELANGAAGVVVSKLGTATVNWQELRQALLAEVVL